MNKLQKLYLIFAIGLGALLFTSHETFATDLTISDQMVLQDYQKIQEALASDTLKPVATFAQSISRSVRNDRDKRLPNSLADQADKLSKDKDLKSAREDFKALSSTLIAYLEKENIKGTGYQQNFCPMAKASWLEKGKDMNNPYLGKSMPGCGEAKRSF